MNLVITLSLALFAPTQSDIKLRTLTGESHSGKLLRLSDSEIVIVSGGEQSFAPAKLESIAVNDAASTSNWAIQVNLVDGSAIRAAAYSTLSGKAQLKLTEGSTRDVPLKAIASVRLREQAAPLARQWLEYLAEEAESDRIVIRRKAKPEDGGGESLDVLEGVIRDVSEATVNFDSGELLKVKRERIDGLLYFRGREPAPPPGLCTIVDIDGSAWVAKSAQLADGKIKLETPSGVTVELPLAQIRKIDYASGNRRYLSELPRDSLVRETWVTDGKSSSLAFEPLTGRTPQGAISIGGERPAQALWMPAKSAMIVRVPPGFTRFRAQVGIDDRVGNTDGARLLVEADGKTLYDQVHARTPQLAAIDVDLNGARRVRITVDYGGESFLGDQLVLCEAMFVK